MIWSDRHHFLHVPLKCFSRTHELLRFFTSAHDSPQTVVSILTFYCFSETAFAELMCAELLVEACDPVFIPNLVNILCARNGTMLVIASAKTQSHVAKGFALEMNTQKVAE